MLDIEQIASFYPEPLRPFQKHLLREYLQHKILEALFEMPLSEKLTFMGGTCIHIVHGSPRFSEDLDFDNTGIHRHDFKVLLEKVKRNLELQGVPVELKMTFKDAFRAFFRFPGLLHAYGIAGHRDEKLLIQIDTEPQEFEYVNESFLLNKFDVFSRIRIVPADVLAAQKIVCIFNRRRPMGRDFFDVVFLAGKTKANVKYLAQKLSIQTQEALRKKLLFRCKTLDFARLTKDLEPFVYSKKELNRVAMFMDFIRQEI